MKNSVNIDPQERYIWISTDIGWERRAGFFAKWCGMDVTIFANGSNLVNTELVISSRKSGMKMISLWINPLEFLQANTKEKTLVTFREMLAESSKSVTEEVIRMAKRVDEERLPGIVEKFGPMPPVEIIEDWDREVTKNENRD